MHRARFRAWTRGLRWFTLAACFATTAPALAWQFREIVPEPVTPRATEPAAAQGEPTPAEPPASLPVQEPAPAAPITEEVTAGDLPEPSVPLPPPPAADHEETEPAPLADAASGAAPESPAILGLAETEDFLAAAVRDPGSADESPGAAQGLVPVRFLGVEPGLSLADDVRSAWGEPFAVSEQDGQAIWSYKLQPFRQVDVSLETDRVGSILLHLTTPLPLDDVARQLDLDDFDQVPIPDETGEVLGQAYPERAVLLSFAPESEEAQVAQILFEPLRGETFRLRAEYDFQRRYQRNLGDLEVALRLDATDARAHWLKADILASADRVQDALESVEQAVKLAPTETLYRLTRARLLAARGQYEEGLSETRQIAQQASLPAEVQARAACQLGDLIALNAAADYQQAMQHHLRAIELAVPLANAEGFAVRRAAKRVLVDAHLAVAYDIAAGHFQRKHEVVPRWLKRASELVDELITRDSGDETLRLDVYRQTLVCFAAFKSSLDPSVATEEALKEGRRLIAQVADPLYQYHVQWTLAEALFHAMRIERARGDFDVAMRYANNAIALAEAEAEGRQYTPQQEFLLGQLYFLVGSLHAVYENDHHEAVRWFDKSTPLLNRPLPISPLAEQGLHGETFVSMGVSYWETGARAKAIRLTQEGVQIMREAVQSGQLEEQAMAVPYGNLATMHRQMGNEQTAHEFAEMAARLEGGRQTSPQR